MAAQGDEKLLPLGRALDRVLARNYYMLPMWYMGEKIAWRAGASSPCLPCALSTPWALIPGGMTLTKPPDFPLSGDKIIMGAYLLRRLLLVIPTLWAIITINFFIVQIAPGGPVDQAIAAIEFGNSGGMPGGGGEGMGASHARTGVGNISESHYRGGRGLDQE